MSVSKLALVNGVNANMVFKWRRELRAGLFDDVPERPPALLPVVLIDTPVMAAPAMATTAVTTAASDPIEIAFADAVIRVRVGADAALLRMIFQSLRA